MALPPSERLARFGNALLPTAREVESAERRADRIAARLQREMDVRRILPVGSHWKQTAVRRHSDYDLFVVVSKDEARRWAPSFASDTLIRRVRRLIATSYPSTRLKLDKQAVTVGFEQGEHAVDVVPAFFELFDRTQNAPVYLIPDGEGGWLRTAPDMDKELIDQAHQRSGRKLRTLARMLKWWSASRHATAPLSSLYLERFIVALDLPVPYSYQESLLTVFDRLAKTGLPALRDPFGVSDSVLQAVRTRGQQLAVLAIAERSAERAEKALAHEARSRFGPANVRWEQVFNGSFPSLVRAA